MKILIINPNTTSEMTKVCVSTALEVKDTRSEIVGATNTKGPKSMEGFMGGVITTEGVLEIIINEEKNYNAFVIACFSSHPSIKAGRELTKKPVVGIFEASVYQACLIGHKFGIVTTSKRKEPLLESGIIELGIASRCSAIKSTGLSVSDLGKKNPDEIAEILLKIGRKTIEEDGTEVILLGCSGMAGLNKKLEKELGVPVIDPVEAAIKMAEALICQGLFTSKINTYSPMKSSEIKNLPSAFDKVYK